MSYLADTAQSITDGVDFRFEEVRSCYYKAVSEVKIFERPDRLQTNFRSHDGIIQTANNVLDMLRLEFKESFDKMDIQTGLAYGIQ
jgi:ATP-dependent exoDNAse (exonuclease V) beta subunit